MHSVLVGWAGFEPATSASRTGLRHCYQAILARWGTLWRGSEPISLVVRRQVGGMRASAAWLSQGFAQLAASDPGLESPTGPRLGRVRIPPAYAPDRASTTWAVVARYDMSE
jgi:hypothetical protein